MNDTDTRYRAHGDRRWSDWLQEEIRLSAPRYAMLLAACAVVALVLVAID